MCDRSEIIHEHLSLEKGFIDNYSIWSKFGETTVNAQGNTEQARIEGNIEVVSEHGNNDDTDVVHDSHCGEGFFVEELSCNVAREELLEKIKSGLDNLETMEKVIHPTLVGLSQDQLIKDTQNLDSLSANPTQ
jgi:hypothetical protein